METRTVLLVAALLRLVTCSCVLGGTCANDETSLLQVSHSVNSRSGSQADALDFDSPEAQKHDAESPSDPIVDSIADSIAKSIYKSIDKTIDKSFDKSIDNRQSDADGEVEVFELTGQPLGDSRKYQGAVLANGLQVVNIQDSNTLSSAMSMGVMSGSYNNPDEIPGLAHFCEHMLFLGSRKFPKASAFDDLMSKIGGDDNAYTAAELTDFFFESDGNSAFGVMPMFADWFSEPAFNSDYVNKEVHAINSEFEKNVQSPTWRMQSLLSHLSNPESVTSRFRTGNINTLITEPKKQGIDTVDALRKYFKEHYCASKMRLVTFGSKPLKEQFAESKAHFSSIPAGSQSCRKPQNFSMPPSWPPSRLGKWVTMLGTEPTAQMVLMFPTTDLDPFYKSVPDAYLKHVFNYGGLQSLTRTLNNELGLVQDIGFDTDSSTAGGKFYLQVSLTRTGQKHKATILDVIFAYIATVRQAGVDKDMYESLKHMTKLSYDWQGASDASSTVSAVSATMGTRPIALKDVLWAQGRIDEVDVPLVSRLMEDLTPDNMLAIYISPGPAERLFGQIKAETMPHYGTKYIVQEFDDVYPGRKAKWKDWISGHTPLPSVRSEINNTVLLGSIPGAVNPLTEFPVPPGPITHIPEHIPLDKMHAKDLSGDSDAGPTQKTYGPLPSPLLDSTRSVQTWYRQGWVTNSPKAKISTSLQRLRHKGDAEPTARQHLEYTLYADMLGKFMVPRLYDLTLTGVDFGITATHQGLGFSFAGFTPNMNYLIGTTMKHYKEFLSNGDKLTPKARFLRAKESLHESLQTYSAMPITYAISDRTTLVTTNSLSNEELLEALDKVTLSSSLEAGRNVIKGKPLVLSALAMGNIDQKNAEKIVSGIKDDTPGASQGLSLAEADSDAYVQRIMPIVKPAGPVELRKKNPRAGDTNDVGVVSVLLGVSTIPARVTYGIISSILKSTAYTELRTQRQLGYVVNAGAVQLSNVMGVSIVAQGNRLRADDLEAAIESIYFKYMPEKLAKLSDADFKTAVHSYRQSLITPPTSDADEFSQYLDPVVTDRKGKCFKLSDEMMKFIDESVTSKQILIDAWNEVIKPSSGMRQKISVKYFGGDVPPRPSASKAKAIYSKQGVPDSALDLLEQEHKAATVVSKADSSTRKKLREAGSEYPTDLFCALETPAKSPPHAAKPPPHAAKPPPASIPIIHESNKATKAPHAPEVPLPQERKQKYSLPPLPQERELPQPWMQPFPQRPEVPLPQPFPERPYIAPSISQFGPAYYQPPIYPFAPPLSLLSKGHKFRSKKASQNLVSTYL